jgi:hypothetical protein
MGEGSDWMYSGWDKKGNYTQDSLSAYNTQMQRGKKEEYLRSFHNI